MNCTFTPNAEGLWQCSACGWTYKRTINKPPRRHCPSRPTDIILAQYDHIANPLPITRNEAARRAGICQANECGQFTGRSCKERTGGRCGATQRWFERITLADCAWWNTVGLASQSQNG